MLESFADGTIFGSRSGSRPARVLFLHGWGWTHRSFDAVLAAPSNDAIGELDAIAVDLPGFGATPAPPTAWDTAQYAKALLPVLAEMGDEIVIVGHSFGGLVALHLARLDPRVRSLVLVGVPLYRPTAPAKPRARFRAIRSLARHHLVPSAVLERARERYGSSDYVAASGVMRDVLVRTVSEHYDDDIAAIDVPVVLVWGEHDETVPIAVAQRAAAAFSNATLTIALGAGHLTPTDAPDTLRGAIVNLL